MKSRQKGKKKGSSKERVFGCDLQDHLQHSGQEGKAPGAGRGQASVSRRARRKGAGCHPEGERPAKQEAS